MQNDKTGNRTGLLYNAVGNTTSIGGTAKEFVYNGNDRMSQVKLAGVVNRSYRYNAKGERVAASNGASGPVAVYTLYDEAGHWLGDYDANGATQQQAVWLGESPVGVLAGAGTAQKLHYIQPDHLGTPRTVIDASRNVAIWSWNAKGEAFGNDTPNQDPDQDGTAFVFDLRFPGQRFDAATGLNYNYFRDYDSGIGRYVQSDPIGLEGGSNLYGYVEAKPLSAVDPEGLNGLVPRPLLSPRTLPIGPATMGSRVPWHLRPQIRIQPRAGKPKTDIPSWARGSVPRNGEKPIQFARRVCEEFGQSTKEGPGNPFNMLKKYAETHFKPDGEAPGFFSRLFGWDEVYYYEEKHA